MGCRQHPTFLSSPHSQSPERTLALFSYERHTASGRKHSNYKRGLRRWVPIWGSLTVRSCLQGPGTRKTSLNKKVTTDTALPSPQNRRFKDFLRYPPFTWWICLFLMWQKVSTNLCKLYSILLTWNRCRDQAGLLEFSSLTWKKKKNLKRCICTLGKE